jgi:surface polysaccharide O-acyltransferase-like enzyme
MAFNIIMITSTKQIYYIPVFGLIFPHLTPKSQVEAKDIFIVPTVILLILILQSIAIYYSNKVNNEALGILSIIFSTIICCVTFFLFMRENLPDCLKEIFQESLDTKSPQENLDKSIPEINSRQ